jgi:hypothetical protein
MPGQSASNSLFILTIAIDQSITLVRGAKPKWNHMKRAISKGPWGSSKHKWSTNDISLAIALSHHLMHYKKEAIVFIIRMSGIACLGVDQTQVSKRWASTRPNLFECWARDWLKSMIESTFVLHNFIDFCSETVVIGPIKLASCITRLRH